MRTLIIVTALLLSSAPRINAETSTDYIPESRSTSETFSTKVVKVYAFHDGDVDYVAYVVHWKDHEVVVTPSWMMRSPGPAGSQQYKVGDTIHCRMVQDVREIGDSAKRQTVFLMEFDSASDPRRFEAVAAEVARRRAIREAEAKEMGAPQPAAPTPSKPSPSAPAPSH